MAIEYRITRWNSRTAMQAQSFVKVSRSDAAENRVWEAIYAMLESKGLLDRPCAQRLLAEFEASAMNGNFKAPRHGFFRSQTFWLRQDREGPHVVFEANRV